MDPYMTELFGRGSRLGLLHYIGDGTLCVNNVHKAASHMIPQVNRPRPSLLVATTNPCSSRMETT
jgi:hypothetical protein